MKKTYIAPVTERFDLDVVSMMAASIKTIGGGASGLTIADSSDPVPTDADVKENVFEENPFEY